MTTGSLRPQLNPESDGYPALQAQQAGIGQQVVSAGARETSDLAIASEAIGGGPQAAMFAQTFSAAATSLLPAEVIAGLGALETAQAKDDRDPHLGLGVLGIAGSGWGELSAAPAAGDVADGAASSAAAVEGDVASTNQAESSIDSGAKQVAGGAAKNQAVTEYAVSEAKAQGAPHTTLGGRVSSENGEIYRQSATFPGPSWPSADGEDVPWSRTDWTDHADPEAHPNPHQHEFFFETEQKRWTERPASPFYPELTPLEDSSAVMRKK